MDIKEKNSMNASAQANSAMRTTGKLLGVSTAIALLLATGSTELGVVDAVNVVPGSVVPAGTQTQSAALHAVETDAAHVAFDTRFAAVSSPAQVDAWTPQASGNALTNLANPQAGPPALADTEADVAQPSSKTAPRDKMSGPVAALVAAGGAGLAEIVIRYDSHPELFDDERVAALGGEVIRRYQNLDMRVIRIPATSLEQLAGDDNIDWLSVDDEMSATSTASRAAANLPVAGAIDAGYDGSNIGIAVLDTGISAHDDLSDDIVQYSFLNGAYPIPDVTNGQISTLNDSGRVDLFGHGTHVAGILSGSGVDSAGDFSGSATGAKVLALQVLDQDGGGTMSDVMAALDWLQSYGSYFNIRVVNLSLGKNISESNETDPLVIAIEELWDAGMVVVVAAGNDGYQGSMTVTSPGNSRKVITVGSLTDNATGTDYDDDYVSSFSSQGPTIGNYVLKPDLVAPGNRVVAAIPEHSLLAVNLASRIQTCTRSGCNSEYLEMSGTSMATPMVSAAVALMLDKDPSLTPATVKARLMRSALKLDADPTEAGAGLLDISAALSDSGTVTGEALSPLMVFDDMTGGVLVEDTAVLWGDAVWGSGFLYSNGFSWASGATFTDANGVTASGYVWTDGGVTAKGYQWTDGGLSAKGYQWTDGVDAKSLLAGDSDAGLYLNDDAPGQ